MIRIPKIPAHVDYTIHNLYSGMPKTVFSPKNGMNAYKAVNDDYTVTVNGQECPVHECRVSAMPFNRVWPGKQRPLDQTESAGFVSFSADEEVTLRVKRNTPYKSAVVRPLSKKVETVIKNDEIVFTLSHHGQYVLELDDYHNVLHIFFNKIKKYPDAEKATYYFGPGLHYPGTVTLKDNDTVYVDEEAIVFGSIYTLGAKNIKVYGGGIIDNSNEERLIEHCYENVTKGTFRIYGSENVTVEDVIFTNSSTWIMSMFYCNNVKIDNVKLVGHWRYNTDGIDICNTSNVTVTNSFVRAFDDVITIKGIYRYDRTPIENITVDNCVLWCGWGNTCEIGIETQTREYRNITFRNCDVIHASGPALSIPNGNYAYVHDVTYENMNVEFQSYSLPEVYQDSDDKVYNPNESAFAHLFIHADNGNYNFPEDLDNSCGIFCRIADILYKNVNAYTDSPDIKPIIRIINNVPKVSFSGFVIDGLYLNGEKQNDYSNFTMIIRNAPEPELK